MLFNLKLLLNQLRGQQTIGTFNILGIDLKLNISAKRELKRARSIKREKDLVQQLNSVLREGDVFYDVGANIGLISLLANLEPNRSLKHTHCFEPEPRNFGQLKKNITLNEHDHKVSSHQIALGQDEGEVTLHVRGTAGDGRHSISTSKGATDAIVVPMSTVSLFANKTGHWPDVMKIDVEGAEGQVLAGMDSLIKKRPPRDLILEIHSKGDGDTMSSGETIHDWLSDRNYQKVWQHGRSHEAHVHYQQKS